MTTPLPPSSEPDIHVPAEQLLTDFEAPPPGLLAVDTRKDRKRGQLRDIWRRYQKNKLALIGLIVVGILVFIAIFEPFVSPYDAHELNTSNTTAKPDGEHWFGTDKLGRDYFSMVLFGTKLAIIVGVSTMILSLVVGVSLGALAGYKGRYADTVIMRITDVFLSFPPLIAAIILVRAVGAGIEVVILALSLLGWTTSARLMRGQTLALRESEYVEAARSIGASDSRIVLRHILPNAIGPVLILAFSGIGVSIVAMASLAYLGIGVPPDTPEWGRMIADALPYARIPGFGYLWVFPSAAIVLTTLAFAFVADGLRDALDPKLR